jgi:hypothetical protein
LLRDDATVALDWTHQPALASDEVKPNIGGASAAVFVKANLKQSADARVGPLN